MDIKNGGSTPKQTNMKYDWNRYNKAYKAKKKANGLCAICVLPRVNASYCETHRAKAREHGKAYWRKLSDKVYQHYGDMCSCCGERTREFLTLDHVNNDGAKQRRDLYGNRSNTGGSSFYRWVIENHYPDSLQILCSNCNLGKFRNGGECPHRKLVYKHLINNEQKAA